MVSNLATDKEPLDGAAILKNLGGITGILESLVPGTLYVTLFSLTLNVVLAASVAGVVSVLFAIYQVVRKRPLTQVIAGVVGLGISIYLPLRDGLSNTHAADYFVPGLLTNLGYAAAFAISLLVRFPLAGLVLGFFGNNSKSWRGDKAVYRRYAWITAMWLGMFLVRLLVEVPLYLSGSVAGLGVAKLVLGTPFYALIIWFSWLLARVTFTSAK